MKHSLQQNHGLLQSMRLVVKFSKTLSRRWIGQSLDIKSIIGKFETIGRCRYQLIHEMS